MVTLSFPEVASSIDVNKVFKSSEISQKPFKYAHVVLATSADSETIVPSGSLHALARWKLPAALATRLRVVVLTGALQSELSSLMTLLRNYVKYIENKICSKKCNYVLRNMISGTPDLGKWTPCSPTVRGGLGPIYV